MTIRTAIPSPSSGARDRQGHAFALTGVAGALALAGCAAGPNYAKPAPPTAQSYTAQPLAPTVRTPGVVQGESQQFAANVDIPGDWWTLFHSQPLNALVEQALSNSPDLKAAQAALAAAHETTLAQKGAFLPQIGAGFSASRQQQSEALAPTPDNNAFQYSLFTPQLTVGYTPDVFGLTRRTVEQAKAQEQSSRFQMIAVRLTLTSNVAQAAIQQAAIQAQIDAARETIDLAAKMVETVRYQLSKGYASGLDLAAQQSQLTQAQAALPPLVKQFEQQQHLLAILVGGFPGQTPAQDLKLDAFQLPASLPVSLPSALVEQRPDIRQAEANLHAASAEVGIAAANRLPNIQLTGSAGSTALDIGQTFGPGTAFWAIGAEITQPIFEGGTLLHQEKAARDNYVQASEQYRSTVLTAVQNVADSLTAIERDAEALKAAADAADAAKTTMDLSERQYHDGYASYLTLLSAEQAYQQARSNLAQMQAARLTDTAALFQALGGGWWRDPQLAQPELAQPELAKADHAS